MNSDLLKMELGEEKVLLSLYSLFNHLNFSYSKFIHYIIFKELINILHQQYETSIRYIYTYKIPCWYYTLNSYYNTHQKIILHTLHLTWESIVYFPTNIHHIFFFNCIPTIYSFANTYLRIQSVVELDSKFGIPVLTKFTFYEDTTGYITIRVCYYKYVSRQNNYKLINVVVKINNR